MTLDEVAYLADRAIKVTPNGVHSNVRSSGPKVFIERAQGAWIWDVDGKDYVDHLLGQGPNFLGHSPQFLLDAVNEGMGKGIIYGGQHVLELEAAEAVLDALSWPEQLRFALTGSEAVQAVLRLARAHTGRSMIVRFEGQYHGWMDNVLMANNGGVWGAVSHGQLEYDLATSIVLPWNDIGAVDRAFEVDGDNIAAVITEPAMINSGAIPPRPGYLQHLRNVCSDLGALLIFDEVITGFRLALGGGAEHFGVTPDLATYGKALGSGVPVAAFAGRSDIMERLTTGTNHSGTFNGNVISSTAALASATRLKTHPPYDGIIEYGGKLMAGLETIASDHGREIVVQGYPMAFHVSFGADRNVTDWRTLQNLDLAGYDSFSHHLVANGVWVTGRGIWFSSSAHGDRELSTVLERFERAISTWPREASEV